MDKEESCEVKTPTAAEVPNSISSSDSDSTLSEEDSGIITLVDSIPFDSVLVSDEEIIEYIYQNLLRLFLSLQIQTVSSAPPSPDAEILCLDGCKTPPPRHTDSKMVPDTCPRAPMKLTKISRNIDPGLRRKLF